MFLLAALPIGCENPEEDSCNIKTPGIYVEFEATDTGSQVLAAAKFWTGNKPGGTSLFLGNCDKISVNGTEMREGGSGQNVYRATIGTADTYDFVFDRIDDGDTFNSTTTTPEAVTISALVSSDEIARDEAFDITWDTNGSGNINLIVEGDCIDDYPKINGGNVSDTGSHTVNAGEITPKFQSDVDKTCTGSVTLTRQKDGTLDPALKGTIRGYAAGKTSFKSTPASTPAD